MLAVREHIHRGAALHAVTLFRQQGEVTGQRFRVAADVDHPLRGHAGHALDELRGGAFPRRVHEDHIRTLPGCGGFADPAGGVGGKEAGILHAVVLCVADGVLHGVAVQLHTHDLFCVVGSRQADGADAAVGVQHHFFPGEMRRFHSQTVQHLGLAVVDLVKAAGAEGIGLAAEGIQNIPLAIQHLFRITQHDAGLAGVHVLHHGGHGHAPLLGFCQQGPHEVLGSGQHGLRSDQHHHHLPGGNAPAQQAVAHKPGALVLIVGLVAAGDGRRTHGLHGLVQHFVLQQAAFHRQHLVTVRCVDAGGEFSTPAGGKGGNHLVAVMVRVFHAADGVHRAVLAQQLFHGGFLLLQLFGIVQPQQRAAAAVLGSQLAIHVSLSIYP